MKLRYIPLIVCRATFDQLVLIIQLNVRTIVSHQSISFLTPKTERLHYLSRQFEVAVLSDFNKVNLGISLIMKITTYTRGPCGCLKNPSFEQEYKVES